MKNLIEKLQKETSTFKETYLQETKEWAHNMFNIVEPRNIWKEVDWCKHMGIEPELTNPGNCFKEPYLSFPKGFYNTKGARTLDRLKDEAYRLFRKGETKFVEQELQKAEKHFQQSLEKLAYRIEKKELDQNNIVTESAHVGVNLEITLTDGNKKVKAYTIIASGPIQRPHYRYLIK